MNNHMLNNIIEEDLNLYDILQISKTATTKEIKQAYLRLSKIHHPDLNPNSVLESTEKFRSIQHAYETLSNLQERSWYDEHSSTKDSGKRSNTYINLYKYMFGNDVYQSYDDDDEKGFYNVYNNVFLQIEKNEEKSMPKFGNSKSNYKETIAFYKYWKNFSTNQNFFWVDKYTIKDARNRKMKKFFLEENNKIRKFEKNKFNAMVKKFVMYVKKRDERFMEYKKKKQEVEMKKMEQKEKVDLINQIKELKRTTEEIVVNNIKETNGKTIDDNGIYENELKRDQDDLLLFFEDGKKKDKKKKRERKKNRKRNKILEKKLRSSSKNINGDKSTKVEIPTKDDDVKVKEDDNDVLSRFILNEEEDDEKYISKTELKKRKKNRRKQNRMKKTNEVKINVNNNVKNEKVDVVDKKERRKRKRMKKKEKRKKEMKEKEKKEEEMQKEEEEMQKEEEDKIKKEENGKINNIEKSGKVDTDEKNEKREKNEMNKQDSNEEDIKKNSEENVVDKNPINETKKQNKINKKKVEVDFEKITKKKKKASVNERKKKRKSKRKKKEEKNICDVCKEEFPSRSKLFLHIKEKGHASPK